MPQFVIHKGESAPSPPVLERKTCSRCREEKPVSEFYALRTSPDGYQRQCKACNREAAANHRKVETPRNHGKGRLNRRFEKVCEYCGEVFLAARSDALYCRPPKLCAQRARRGTPKEES